MNRRTVIILLTASGLIGSPLTASWLLSGPIAAWGAAAATEQASAQEQPTTAPELPMISLEKAVHFQGPGGTDVKIPRGVYQLELEESKLRLTHPMGKPSYLIEAEAVNHDYLIEVLLAVSVSGGKDRHHLLLLLPEGKSFQAIGSYSGMRPRGITGGIVHIAPQNDMLAKFGDIVEVDFDWSMEPRFGVSSPSGFIIDRNKNSLPDLPNTFEYVHNLPPGTCPRVTYSEPPVCPTVTPKFRVYLDAIKTRACSYPPPGAPRFGGPLACSPGRIVKYEWGILAGEPGLLTSPLKLTSAPGTPATVDLPESHYFVTLTATAEFGASQGGTPRVVTASTNPKLITVEDLLIVALGDSFAAGEGNPESRGVVGGDTLNQVWWADDGDSNTYLDRLYVESIDENGNKTTLGTHYFALKNNGKPGYGVVAREHLKAHRSTIAAPAQAAKRIEAADPRTSVTFVSLAASGAGIETGVINAYPGQDPFVGGPPLMSQIEALKRLVGRRKIDALVISIGVNDAGFSQAIQALIMHPHGDITYSKIAQAVHDGIWKRLDKAEPLLVNIAENLFTGQIRWQNRLGLDKLFDMLFALDRHLQEKQLTILRTYLMGYPDPTTLWENGKVVTCPEALTAAAGGSGYRLDRSEMDWARQNIIQPLNDILLQAAGRLSQPPRNFLWTYVTPADYRGHGICAGGQGIESDPNGRWIRRHKESNMVQGPELSRTTGTMHPNSFGHQAQRDQLLKHLVLPVKVPGVGPQ